MMKETILSDWKRAKIATRGHDTACRCADCKSRTRLSGVLRLPYASGKADLSDITTENTSLKV